MAPIKRSRAVTDGGPFSSQSLSQQSQPRKKARTSNILALRGESDDELTDASTSSDEQEEQGEPEEEQRREEESDLDEDALEERATQTIRERYSRHEENVAQENGVIERVDCHNFMCHKHFSVDLGPLINFIVGKNGSGKSAVLTAITLCLGGKASVTNRGQSLKSFIKEGEESATVIVRIKNRGDSAYLPNEYGDSIIVERHFSKNGSSGFKLKSASGRVVSTKKGDLDAITDYYALQIDNPMNVLSQDMARQFLSSSSPAEKYKFFVKGVQLEQLDQDYRLMEESIDQGEERLQVRREELKIAENNKRKADSRLALSDRHDGLRARVRNLRGQMAWAQVEEQERIRDMYDDQIADLTRRITDLEGEVEKADEAYQNADAEHNTAVQAVQEANAEVESQRDERKGIQEKHDEVMGRRHDLQAQQRVMRDEIKAATARVQDAQQKIEAENQHLEQLDGGSIARRQEELKEAEAEAKELLNRYQEHQRDFGRLQEEIRKADVDLKAKREPIERQKEEINQAENQLRNLAKNRQQQEGGFHEKMPLLLRAIRQETSFGRAPVGPIGQHIKLLKPKWSSVLETSFGTTLSSFVVTSKRDSNILSGIMDRVGCPCPIFIGNDQGTMDTSNLEPDAQFDTALRVLEIDNDLVRRQLIINHGIEQMLLIEDVDEAMRVLFDGAKPRNVKRCYCIDRRDRRRGIHLSFTRGGEPARTPVQAYTGRPRMKTDIESQISLQREAVETLKQGLHDLDQQFRQSRSHLEKCKQALERHKRQGRDLQFQSQKAEDLVEELKDAISRDTVEDGRLEALKVALSEAEEEKRVNEGSFEDSVIAMDAIHEELKAVKRELFAKDAQIDTCQKKVDRLQKEEEKLSKLRRKALGDKNAAVGRVDDTKRDKSDMERKRAETAQLVLNFSEQANQVSPRVPIDPGETANSLDKKLEKIMRDLSRCNTQMGASREEIAAEAKAANETFELIKQQVQDFEADIELLKRAHDDRRRRWEKFRAHISFQAKAQFTYLLSERSFRGRLLTNHKAKLLDLHVEPDITKKNGEGRGAKTLSGGEKSFSQICLLLALWEAMGSPIRCLDEFDVYMDSVNRRMAIEMLMTAARRSIGKQFILITPGSRSEIRVAPDVRVKELAEPERGQRTLPFA